MIWSRYKQVIIALVLNIRVHGVVSLGCRHGYINDM